MSPSPPLDWAVAELPFPGETVSGDTWLLELNGDAWLAAAIDGLGHGERAAEAAVAARETIRDHAGEPIAALMERAHQALHGTRGAAVTLVELAPGTMRWLAIGNVAAVRVPASGAARHVPLRGGIVGERIPSLRVVDEAETAPGDVIVLATDGVASQFSRAVDPAQTARTIADTAMREHGRGTDDALVLALRLLGGEAPESARRPVPGSRADHGDRAHPARRRA